MVNTFRSEMILLTFLERSPALSYFYTTHARIFFFFWAQVSGIDPYIFDNHKIYLRLYSAICLDHNSITVDSFLLPYILSVNVATTCSGWIYFASHWLGFCSLHICVDSGCLLISLHNNRLFSSIISRTFSTFSRHLLVRGQLN